MRWRMRVVLPAPRKPVMTVAGMRRITMPGFRWVLARG
jgi:hypothetical protein